MKKVDPALALLAIGLFLCPIIGGNVSLDSIPSSDGILLAAPLLIHTLIGLFPALAFLLLMRRQVIQVPNTTLALFLALFFGVFGASAAFSSFRLTSMGAMSEWFLYAIAFFATVGAAGRRTGPIAIIGSIFGASLILALIGIKEYGEFKAIDPSWRIFAGWVNPNATAAMLMVGYVCGLGCQMVTKGRMPRLVIGMGTAAIALAIFLTGSKGGFLVTAITVPLFLILVAPLKQKDGLVRVGGTLVASVVLVAALMLSAKVGSGNAAGVGAAARIASAGETGEQSAGFRSMLWKGAAQIIQKRPIGYGAGTYRYESTRSGLNTQTTFAHQSFLQLGVESSILAPLLLITAGLLWIRLVFRGWSKLPPERKLLQSTVLASVFAVVAHSMVDSDLYYFGLGMCFFALMGLGLLLSADAVAPEFSPKGMRAFVALGTVGVLALGFFTGGLELNRAGVRTSIQEMNYPAALAGATALTQQAPMDGEAWYFLSQLTASPDEQLRYAERATEFSPSPRNFRYVARLLASRSRYPEALVNLRYALQRDPNNLPALTQMAQIQESSGDQAGATETYRKLVAIEETPYYKVRSIPELVPTDTFIARIKLAATAQEKEKISLLAPAVEGFRRYLAMTVPLIKRNAPRDFGGETKEVGKRKMDMAAAAARDLAAAYRAVGDTAGATEVEGWVPGFEGAFAGDK